MAPKRRVEKVAKKATVKGKAKARTGAAEAEKGYQLSSGPFAGGDPHTRLRQAIDRLDETPTDDAQRRRVEAAYRLLTDETLDPAASVVLDVAQQHEADRQWNERLGPFLTRATVARLLGISKQAVAKRRDLLAIPSEDGWAYPAWQFSRRRTPDRFDEVLQVLPSDREPLLVAAWLKTSTRMLGGDTPIQRLRVGDVDAVLRAAKAYAARLSR